MQKARSASVASSRSSSLPASTRLRSLSKQPSKFRGSSVDSSSTRRSKSTKGSDDSKAGDKRKDPPSSAKSAKFAEGIKDNEGKTASTKKAAKAKKKESSSYASKAAQEKKKSWIYDTVIEFKMKLENARAPVGKCIADTSKRWGSSKPTTRNAPSLTI